MSESADRRKAAPPAAPFHYCPPDGYFGDPIPFFWNDEYHLFYLIGQFDPWRRVRYTPYRHLVSTDLVNWSELPVAIELGGPDDVDMSLGTGTAIERDGTFYFFYCGRRFLPGDGGTEVQWEVDRAEAVCLATSTDLVTWERDPRNPLIRPDGIRYEESDFRDPYVFWNEKESCYWMVISARIAKSPLACSGGLALATSTDLERWELRDPLWVPALRSPNALECPDIFRTGRKWYMFYSTDAMTSYRVADAPEGPWSAVEPDIWDNWAFYAAKTMFTGSRRFLIGWIATREDDTDLGPVQWGGHCAIPRELVPLPDGTLAQRCPPEIIDVYREEVALSVRGRTGRWRMVGETVEAARADGFAYASLGGQSDGLIEMSVKMRGPVCSAGVVFRASPDLSSYCALRVEPARRRVVIDRVPQIGEVNFRCERHLSVDEGEEVDVKLFLDGDMVEAFVGERRALGCRAYDFGDGEIGLYVEHGEAVFSNVRMRDVGG